MAVDPTEVDRLYDTVLLPRLDSLEGLRLELRGTIRKAAALVVGPVLLLVLGPLVEFVLPESVASMTTVIGVVLLVAGVVTAALRYALPGMTTYLNYQQQFKEQVVSEIFRIVCPTATYEAEAGIPATLFDAAGLFNTRGQYRSDDLVRGTIGETPFEAAEVERTYSTGGKNSRTYVVFRGLFFHIDFNKHVRGTTIVEPRGAPDYRVGDRSGLERVTLENPAFAREFTVFTDDEVEARYILTPVMLEQLLALRERSGHPIYMAFKGHRVFLGLNVGRRLFEPGIRTSTSREAVQEMARLFAMAEAIVHELDLNTRIWTKDVDASLLKRDDERQPDPRMDAVKAQARAGTLTPEALLAAAMAARPGYQADDSGEIVERPAGTSIEVIRSPGEATIAYGGIVRIVVLMGLWVACLVVSISAARALLVEMRRSSGLGPLAVVLDWLPAVPIVDDYTPMVPIAWLAFAASIGAMLQLSWMLRVRTVTITADAIRIARGLRPWPRTYPRPPYGKVVVMQRLVYIAKTSGMGIMNTSASPALTQDEATWVAYEMRRALRETETGVAAADGR